jgi:hypothetical protein
MVPPARPYPLTAPFRELRVLALLAAAGTIAGVPQGMRRRHHHRHREVQCVT